jgi:hypothetical protein
MGQADQVRDKMSAVQDPQCLTTNIDGGSMLYCQSKAFVCAGLSTQFRCTFDRESLCPPDAVNRLMTLAMWLGRPQPIFAVDTRCWQPNPIARANQQRLHMTVSRKATKSGQDNKKRALRNKARHSVK